MEYERNGLEIVIQEEHCPESPRSWDNVGTMICSHRNYDLGDEQFNSDDYDGWEDLEKHLREERGAVVVLPLSLYDHSGITMSVGVSHGWDSGQVGFIYCTQEQIDYEWEGDLEKAENYLRGEVNTYDQYLRGDIYGFSITDPKTGEEIDRCCGFYGIEHCISEANEAADAYEHPRQSMFAKKASLVHG